MRYKAPVYMLRSLILAVVLVLSAGCGRSWPLPQTPGVEAHEQVEGGRLKPGETRFLPSVCARTQLQPEYAALDEQSVVAFLKQQGFPVRAARARSDLIFVEVRVSPNADPVRLRIAVLNSVPQAAQELHAAVREHGAGSWGVHRANLAVLIPEGRLEDIVAFAAKTKLACWGVVTVQGSKEAFVIPGGYREL